MCLEYNINDFVAVARCGLLERSLVCVCCLLSAAELFAGESTALVMFYCRFEPAARWREC